MATFRWNGMDLTVMRGEYNWGSGKQLAILCFDDTDPECDVASGIPYGILTVNLDDPRCEPLDEDYACQFLDVNNWPGIEWILSHDDNVDWAEPTRASQQSGFVNYPLWMFDLTKIPHV